MLPSASHRGADALSRDLFALLGREHTLPLLETALRRPRTVGELADALDAPRRLIRRRVWSLEERDLVRTRAADDDGDRRLVVASNLRRLALDDTGGDDGYAVDVTYADDRDTSRPAVWARIWRTIGDSDP